MKKNDVSNSIAKYKGNISAIARAHGKTRTWIYEFIRDRGLWPMVEEARESMTDNVESALYKQALSGNTTAMIFYLKTQGKSRGYVEKTQQENSGETKIIIEYADDWREDNES